MTEPPYAADVKARGWRFELDMERVRRSDTWSLAPAEIRPWLLMMWTVAWDELPCGSLPDDDEVIAAKLGMPQKLFARHSKVMRRGWWLASDGRLYHDTICERVLHMLDKRLKDAGRARDARERKAKSHANHGVVTRDAHVTHGSVQAEFDTQNPVPSTQKEEEPSVETSLADTAPKRAAEAAPKSRGTRLPSGWQLPREWGLWALEQPGWTEPAIRTEADKFADYWAAKAGRDAVKADWCATWRNWIRNASPPRAASATVRPLNRQLAVEAENVRIAAQWLQQPEAHVAIVIEEAPSARA